MISRKFHKKVCLTQTLNLTFLYVTVSTLKPTVGIVLTDWPNLSLYKMVVFPAASKPSIKIRISLFPKTFDRIFPIFVSCYWCFSFLHYNLSQSELMVKSTFLSGQKRLFFRVKALANFKVVDFVSLWWFTRGRFHFWSFHECEKWVSNAAIRSLKKLHSSIFFVKSQVRS